MSMHHNNHQRSQFLNPKSITAKQILLLLSKSQMNKERLLKQLQQLDIDVSQLHGLSLNQIFLRVQPILRNTYSVKYLGLNQNEMGIISRRIDPTRQTQFFLKEQPQLTYTINKYFYPKPLRVGRKPQLDQEQKINLDNLQNQIKKSFEVNKTSESKKPMNKYKKQDQTLSMGSSLMKASKKKTEVVGSWMSIGKIQNTIHNQKKQLFKLRDQNHISNMSTKSSNLNKKSSVLAAQDIPSKTQTVNSFSKFLNKGVILVKDC